MKMKKIFAVAATTLFLGTAFVGCGESGVGAEEGWDSLASGETVQITFVGRDVETEKANYQAFLNDFNSTHDNIVATLNWYTETTAYNTMLDGSGDKLPDVFMLSNAMFINYAANGRLANIRPYLEESVLDNMYEDGYEVYYFDHTTKTVGKSANAALYGLPKDEGPYALCVNETLLKATVNSYNTAHPDDKIDIDTIMSATEPMKFNYFLEVGKKLKSALGNNQYVCAGYDIQSLIYSNNANYFTDDSGKVSDIDSENFIEAVEYMQTLYKEGVIPEAGTVGGEKLFTAGNALFFYAGPWKQKDYWEVCDFDWNILPVLCGEAEGAVSTAYIGGMCYAISATCKYKDAALELVKYLATDSTAQRTQYKRGQCIPNLISLAEEYSTDSRDLIKDYLGLSGNKVAEPSNRGVWIDAVDGVGTEKTDANGNTYIDKVTGKYRAESFTYNDNWFTLLTKYMEGDTGNYGSFWEKKSNGSWTNVGDALKAYKSSMQSELNRLTQRLERL